MDEASVILFDLHGKKVRRISKDTGMHYEGLRSAAHDIWKKGGISNPMKNKLANLDTAFQVIRHITTASATRDLEALCLSLDRRENRNPRQRGQRVTNRM